MAKKEFRIMCKLRNPKGSGDSMGSRWREIPLNGDKAYTYTILWLKEKEARLGNIVSVAHPDTGRAEKGWEVVGVGDIKREFKEGKLK
jgi:hypothetical protein